MLEIKNISKTYFNKGKNIQVFSDFNLSVRRGEFVSIFGPNGCGKTSLLHIIAGILSADFGSIKFKDKDIESLKVGFVFQDYHNSLLPWLSVQDNLSFPLKLSGSSKEERVEKVAELCKKFNCNINLNLYPYQLSGGQQQFVSLLRGLISNPDIYLLDEPFSSLDYQTTLSMLEQLSKIWEETKITTLFVSHEIDEAIFLSQKIILLGNKPTKVEKIIENNLPYPRKLDLLGTPEFAKIKSEVLSIYKPLIEGDSNILRVEEH